MAGFFEDPFQWVASAVTNAVTSILATDAVASFMLVAETVASTAVTLASQALAYIAKSTWDAVSYIANSTWDAVSYIARWANQAFATVAAYWNSLPTWKQAGIIVMYLIGFLFWGILGFLIVSLMCLTILGIWWFYNTWSQSQQAETHEWLHFFAGHQSLQQTLAQV
jgi:hypothetical protein